MPRPVQRVVPMGATAGVVHPSTGFQLCWCLASNVQVTNQVLAKLSVDGATLFDPDAAAARILDRT